MPESLVEGWTEPIRQQLLADGASFDGSSATLGLELRDRLGGRVDTTGKVTWGTAATSIAKYTPAAGDLRADRSPYAARWTVTISGETAYYPNAKDADVWTVGR